MTCVICEIRKERRFCPAIHGRICPQCCGESREVTLDCPGDCVYLIQARQHEKPRPMQDLEPSALFLQVEIADQFIYRHEHLIMGLSFALAKSARTDRTVKDPDLIAALTTMGRSFETLVNSGLLYETPSPNILHQAIVAELQTMLKEFREAEQKHLGQTRLRDADILRALVFLVRMAHARTSGRPRSRAFADFLISQFPETPASAGSSEEPSRIITP